MGIEEKITFWLEVSAYDIDTAKAMLDTGRYLYAWIYVSPYTHSLLKLAKGAGCYGDLLETQKDLLDQLDPLNIEARYPSNKEQLLKQLSKSICTKLFHETKEFTEWISKKL